jgi:hypothetical protein
MIKVSILYINEFKKDIAQVTYKINSKKHFFHLNTSENLEEYFVIEKVIGDPKDNWKFAGFINKDLKYVKPTFTKLLNIKK